MRPLFVFIVILPFGCFSSPKTETISREAIGSHVKLRGVAMNRKGGAVLVVGETHVWIEGLLSWPDGDRAIDGRTITVEGTLDEDHNLPVFVPKKDEPLVQGIPVPDGTDLHEASHRYILRNARWQ